MNILNIFPQNAGIHSSPTRYLLAKLPCRYILTKWSRIYIYAYYISRENVGAHAIDISILRRKTPTKGESTSLKTRTIHLAGMSWMKHRLNMNGIQSRRHQGSQARTSRKRLVLSSRFRSLTVHSGLRPMKEEVSDSIDQSWRVAVQDFVSDERKINTHQFFILST